MVTSQWDHLGKAARVLARTYKSIESSKCKNQAHEKQRLLGATLDPFLRIMVYSASHGPATKILQMKQQIITVRDVSM